MKLKYLIPILLLIAQPACAQTFGGIFNPGSGSGGGSTSPGGVSGNLQINDAGSFAGILNSPIYVTDPTYGAKCDGIKITDGVTTSSSAVISSTAQYTFVAGDVGKMVTISTAAAPLTPIAHTVIDSVAAGAATLHVAPTGGSNAGTAIIFMATDDTTAIQAAMNAANTVDLPANGTWIGYGNRVIFPKGICGISQGLVIRTGVQYSGQGARESTVKWMSSHTMAATGYEAAFVGLDATSSKLYKDNQFHDFEIDMDSAFTTSYSYTAKAADIVYTKRLRVYNMYLHGSPATTFGTDYPIEAIVVNNIFEDCGKLWTAGGSGGSCWDSETGSSATYSIIFANNQLINVGRSGVRNTNAGDPTVQTNYEIISGNYISSNNVDSECIEDNGTENIVIANNTCIQTVTGVTGYYAIGAGAAASSVGPGLNGLIANNNIQGKWYNGIYLSDDSTTLPNGYSIKNNKITGTVNYGIAININSGNTLTGTTIANNDISLSGAAGIGLINNGTSGTISNINISGNTLYNNARTTGSDLLKSGIYDADTVTNGTLENNVAYDDGAGTQLYGFTIASGITSAFQEANNNFTGNVTQARKISGTSSGILFQLPTTNGTNGYVLQTDGTGITSWTAANGGAAGLSSNNTFTGTNTFQGNLFVPIRTVTGAGAITVSATTDYIICVNKGTGEATTVNLPATPATGSVYIIKDCKGDANTHNITITPAAGNIDGAGTSVMSTNYGSTGVVYDGTQWYTE